jgi:hypothetical protein
MLPWREILGFGQSAALGTAAASPATPAAVLIALLVAARELLGSGQRNGWRRRRGNSRRGGRFGSGGQLGRGPLAWRRVCLSRGNGRRRGSQDRSFLHLKDLLFNARYDFVVFVVILEEVRDIQECIAIEANVHEGRLHAGKHACDAALMDTAGQRIFFFTLIVDFDYLIVFEDCHPGFMAIRRNN